MVDCDEHPESSSCEKPVSSTLKTVVPICIFAVILLIVGIVFFCVVRRRRLADRLAEQNAAQKYRDLGFDDEDEASRRGKRTGNPPTAGSTGSAAFDGQANPSVYLRDEGSSYHLSQLHPSLQTKHEPTARKDHV